MGDAVGVGVAVEAAGEGGEVEIIPETTPTLEIIVITRLTKTSPDLNSLKSVQSPIRRDPKPHLMFQTMPVPATGRKAVLRLTVAIPWCAAGSTSSRQGSEVLASLT